MKKILSSYAGIFVILVIVAVLMTGCGKQHKTSIGGQASAANNTSIENLNL